MVTLSKSILSLLFIFTFSAHTTFAGEGMWLPHLLNALNEGEMKDLGMKMSAEDVYSVNKGSLKDAIVHFGGFCTSEIISPNGLLLTNHHCGYSNIQSHTSLENNIMKTGFWAQDQAAELPNPGLTATLIVRIEDVSEKILKGVKDKMPENERQSIIDKNIKAISSTTEKESYQDIMVRPFFKGNQYFLFVTVTYRDVRLVGTPPDAIGKYGADTDNWVWPRHTGDFSLFRIYAGPDNLPADYSPDNKPYSPKHFLPISLDGVDEGDFTLIFGFPGRTNSYLPSFALEQTVNVVNPIRIGIRDRALNVIDAAMRADEKVRIQYASKQARIANAWKKWQGENLGIKSTGGIERKKAFEAEYEEALSKKKKSAEKYNHILPEFEKLYQQIEPLTVVRSYHSEIMGRNIELMASLSLLKRLVGAYENNGDTGYKNFAKRLEGYFQNFFRNYQPEIDKNVFASLMEHYMNSVDAAYISDFARQQLRAAGKDYNQLADRIYSLSNFTDPDKLMAILKADPKEGVAKIKEDIAYQFGQSLTDTYNEKVANKFNETQDKINGLQREYMAALMEVFPNRKFYPDANSTMRVTYGQVKSYEPKDAVKYLPQTYLSGVIDKYQPGDYEFDLPAKLIDLYEKKDYGQYGKDGKMPVCFIGSNHTTGGNSGSPAIDAHGNLIGLNFDRAWEGTMSDMNYDPRICRNIMVDIRYVLFIVDKFGGASHLIDEMKLVHPKMN